MPVVNVCHGAFPLLRTGGSSLCTLFVLMCVGGNWGHCYSAVFIEKHRRLQLKAMWVDFSKGVCVVILY